VFQRVCEKVVSNVRVEVREMMAYVKDEVVGDVIAGFEAGSGNEIACFDPPAARFTRDPLLAGLFGAVHLSPEDVKIRKECVDGFRLDQVFT
jgi:hypothetical protein